MVPIVSDVLHELHLINGEISTPVTNDGVNYDNNQHADVMVNTDDKIIDIVRENGEWADGEVNQTLANFDDQIFGLIK